MNFSDVDKNPCGAPGKNPVYAPEAPKRTINKRSMHQTDYFKSEREITIFCTSEVPS